MTKDDLIRLDNYGHKELDSLSKDQLDEYAILLEIQRGNVLERIRELTRLTTGAKRQN